MDFYELYDKICIIGNLEILQFFEIPYALKIRHLEV